MTDVDVVIVNYRSMGHKVKCVEAVHEVAHGDSVAIRVIVVNNGDDPVLLETNVRRVGDAVVIHSDSNRGFGAACNIGARQGDARHILFLNPDAVALPGFLRACVSYLDTHPEAGIVGPEIHDGQGDVVASCSDIPTFFDLLLRTTGFHVLLGGRARYPFLPLSAHAQSRTVGQVMGAALMIRRGLFHDLDGFDERFFLYYEDVDLCARARARGMTCYYLKTARVVHIGRVSSSHDTGMALALFIRSGLVYAGLHFGLLAQVMLFIATVVIELPLRLLSGLRGGKSIRGGAVLRAFRLLVSGALP